jgi:hypothetical protein
MDRGGLDEHEHAPADGRNRKETPIDLGGLDGQDASEQPAVDVSGLDETADQEGDPSRAAAREAGDDVQGTEPDPVEPEHDLGLVQNGADPAE